MVAATRGIAAGAAITEPGAEITIGTATTIGRAHTTGTTATVNWHGTIATVVGRAVRHNVPVVKIQALLPPSAVAIASVVAVITGDVGLFS